MREDGFPAGWRWPDLQQRKDGTVRTNVYSQPSPLILPPPPPVWQEKDENSINLFFRSKVPFLFSSRGGKARWVEEERGKLLFHLPSFAPHRRRRFFSSLVSSVPCPPGKERSKEGLFPSLFRGSPCISLLHKLFLFRRNELRGRGEEGRARWGKTKKTASNNHRLRNSNGIERLSTFLPNIYGLGNSAREKIDIFIQFFLSLTFANMYT